MAETTIGGGAPVVASINVFTVDPDNQQRLAELWQGGTEEVMRHLPGSYPTTPTAARRQQRRRRRPVGEL
jgi:hypothetical protein